MPSRHAKTKFVAEANRLRKRWINKRDYWSALEVSQKEVQGVLQQSAVPCFTLLSLDSDAHLESDANFNKRWNKQTAYAGILKRSLGILFRRLERFSALI